MEKKKKFVINKEKNMTINITTFYNCAKVGFKI